MAKRASLYGLLLAVSLLFGYVETLVSPFIPIPGVRIGLANAVVMLLLLYGDAPGAVGVNLTRVGLSALLFGNWFRLLFSLAGAVSSLAVLLLCRKSRRLGTAGLSLLGGVAHNLGQWAVASLWLSNGILYLLPPLIAAGALAGFLVGLAADGVKRVLPKNIF